MSMAKRLLLIAPLALVMVVVVGIVRACSTFEDAWGHDSRDTSGTTLAHYALSLPLDAKSASAYESTAFNGPDQCFLRFSLPEQDVAAYLNSLNAVHSQQSLEATVGGDAAEISDFHLTDWHFDRPSADYAVYDWHAVTAISDSEGWIVVDRHDSEPTIFVLAATMS